MEGEEEIFDGWSEILKSALEDISPDGVFRITGFTGEYYVETFDPKTSKWQQCAIVYVREDDAEVYVTDIAKTAVISGREILLAIKNFAQEIGFLRVGLEDVSAIEIICPYRTFDFSLATLKILTKGQSWYNSLGFESPNHKEEVKKNKPILNMPFRVYFDKMIINESIFTNDMFVDKYITEFDLTPDNIADKSEKMLEELFESGYFKDLNSLSVKQFVSQVISIIKLFQTSECDNKQKIRILSILDYIISLFGMGVLYDNSSLYISLEDE